MKDYFNKKIIEKYQLTQSELVKTNWFQQKINKIFDFID